MVKAERARCNLGQFAAIKNPKKKIEGAAGPGASWRWQARGLPASESPWAVGPIADQNIERGRAGAISPRAKAGVRFGSLRYDCVEIERQRVSDSAGEVAIKADRQAAGHFPNFVSKLGFENAKRGMGPWPERVSPSA